MNTTEKKLSNKLTIYQAWSKGTKDVKKLSKLVEDKVKTNTIRGWLSGWSKGRRLPASVESK